MVIGRFGREADSYPVEDMEEFDLTEQEVLEMITYSVPTKDMVWNRRYGNLLFNIRAEDILGIKLKDEKKGYCSECKGVGFFKMFDDIEEKSVNVKCHQCAV